MNIKTKYDIDQTVYFQIDDQWCSGVIKSFWISKDVCYCVIGDIVGYFTEFCRMLEDEVTDEKPHGFDQISGFVNLRTLKSDPRPA